MENIENPTNNKNDLPEDIVSENAILSPEDQKRLNELRQIQIDREFTPEEMEEFLHLQEKEKEVKDGIEFTRDEENELRDLRKIQMDREFTPEERERFLFLQNKEEKHKT